MRELSLFSGIGGGLLATQHLLGWETIGYVEINDYCQRVIAQRIGDGFLHNAPIFSDVKTFLTTGCADLYQGVTDVITAGFSCQPFSVAGKRKGKDDNRNVWPETIECIRRIRPKYAFLENVPGLLSSGYFGTAIGDLAEIGYDAKWTCLSAADCGAPHKRKRLWILCTNNNCNGLQFEKISIREKQKEDIDIAWSDCFTHTCGKGLEERKRFRKNIKQKLTPIKRDNFTRWTDSNTQKWISGAQGVSDGLPNFVERVKATGNGQVALVAAKAWQILSEGIV